MTFTQLMAFKAVADNGSVTKGAHLLNVSQPSVSRHLKNLEEYYGVKVFERSAGVTELTDKGRIILRRVNAILFHLEKLKEEVKPSDDLSKSQPLKVAGTYAALALLLPSVMAAFERKHPDTPITLRSATTKDAMTMVLNSTVEIAIVNEKPINPHLESEPFQKEKLILFVVPNHPLARKAKLSLSDVNKARFVSTGGRISTTERILRRFAHQGLKTKLGIRCATTDAVKAFVRERMGVGILFKDAVHNELRSGVFTPLAVPGLELTVQSYITYCAERALSAYAREFLTLLRTKSHKRQADA